MGMRQTFFTALADRTRRRILNLMREQELCVYDLVDALNISQPKISRHLAFLRSANIVSTRREGKWIFYRINNMEDHYAEQLLITTLEWSKEDFQMNDDFNKLLSILSASNNQNDFRKDVVILPKTDTYRNRSQDIETFLL